MLSVLHILPTTNYGWPTQPNLARVGGGPVQQSKLHNFCIALHCVDKLLTRVTD